MPLDRPFDRSLRRARRNRAAASLAAADYLHRRAADELIGRLDEAALPPGEALLIGAADRALIADLRARAGALVCADPAISFARSVAGVQCEEDLLPFRDEAFDLVVSVGVLDTVNDLPGALTLIRRTLRPGGLFLAAFAGAGSLPCLRAAMAAADGDAAAPRVHPQIDVRAGGDLLARAGFARPVADADTIDVRFPNLFALVADLRAMAATNQLAARSRIPIGRAALARAVATFTAAADADRKTAERFAIVYLTGWRDA